MSRTRYRIGKDHCPYFMTSTIVAWLPIFSRPETVEIIFNSWRYLQANRGLILFGYVIMENHLHFIASSGDLSKDVQNIKSFTARQIIDYLALRHAETILQELRYHKLRHKVESTYQLWQEGSHPKRS